MSGLFDDIPQAGAGLFDDIPDATRAPMTALGASNVGAAAGLTGNFSDEIFGGLMVPIELGMQIAQGKPISLGDAYNAALEKNRSLDRQAAEEHPTANTVGQVGGALGLGAVASPVSLSARAAPTAWGMTSAGAMEGGIYGAFFGAGAGEGLLDRGVEAAKGAGLGAATGGALGLATNLGSRAVDTLLNRAKATAAQRTFSRAANADQIDDITGRMRELGPEAMPLDVGPNLQQQATRVAGYPGESRNIVHGAVRARDAGANARITGTIDDTLGPAPLPSQIDDTITAGQRALGPEYGSVFRGAKAVNTENIASNLDAMTTRLRGGAQSAVKKVRQMLNIAGTKELDPNPRTLFEVRNAIDDMMDKAGGKEMANLTVIRQQIDKELGRAVPGIKQVDAKYAELARQREAFGRGQQMLEGGRTAPRPADVAREYRGGALPQGEQVGPSAVPFRLSQGTRAEIERVVGTNANDRVALQRILKGEGDWNFQRLSTLFGQDKAKRLMDLVDAERVFANSSVKTIGQSETGPRIAAQIEAGDFNTSKGFFRNLFNWNFGDAMASAADKLLGSMREGAQVRTNTELARLLTSRDPKAITAAISAVQRAQRSGELAQETGKRILQSLTAPVGQQSAARF